MKTPTHPVYYRDAVEVGEYFTEGPHHGFYCANSAAALIAAIDADEIHGPDGEAIVEIHYADSDDQSHRVWHV